VLEDEPRARTAEAEAEVAEGEDDDAAGLLGPAAAVVRPSSPTDVAVRSSRSNSDMQAERASAETAARVHSGRPIDRERMAAKRCERMDDSWIDASAWYVPVCAWEDVELPSSSSLSTLSRRAYCHDVRNNDRASIRSFILMLLQQN
jgi:hypothetical protein